MPPKSNRIEPWEYNRVLCKRGNEVERFSRRLKGYRCIFTRFEKLDVMFVGLLSYALVADGLRMYQQSLIRITGDSGSERPS